MIDEKIDFSIILGGETMNNQLSSRSDRERAASDESDMYQQWGKLRDRWLHIFECPNTKWGERQLADLLGQAVPGKRVLEIGCGSGGNAKNRIAPLVPVYILAVDISQSRIRNAKEEWEIPGVLEYAVLDVSEPITGVFDVIIGRAVLHHLDYQEVLLRLSRDNLAEHGGMIFYEPLGSNLLKRIYLHFSKSAHSEDERAFERQDLTWFNRTFPGFRLIPVNFLSLPLGALSSILFKRPNNVMLRVADRIDRLLAQHVSFLHAYFRAAIFVISK
jgi:2-polyprenyl-3-methyl-5-hydroxy-6-metoxy-1,4-benzoquinol methylase